ncbi:MAG: hypothetical protein ACI9C4_002798 [Paraglaciecola sp.]|jgi:hypothetical protein
MASKFSEIVKPFVEQELVLALKAKSQGNYTIEFSHLENAHVIGQESTYWHVKVHCLMLYWALRNSRPSEVLGQVFRVIGAATKTVFGLVPTGNTGGANVSPFKVMPIKPEHAAIIRNARARKP